MNTGNNTPHDLSLVPTHRHNGRTSSSNNNEGSLGLGHIDINRVGHGGSAGALGRLATRRPGCIVSGSGTTNNNSNNFANMVSMALAGANGTSNTTSQMRGAANTGARAAGPSFASQPNHHSYFHTNINGSINTDNSSHFSIINNDNSSTINNNNRFVQHAPTSNRTTINNPAPAAAAARRARAPAPRAAHAPAQNNENIIMVPVAESRRRRAGEESPHCRVCFENLKQGGTYCRSHSKWDEMVAVERD
ncbi:hypothetical protein ACHAWC_007611 [Mediolabrus comicus]